MKKIKRTKGGKIVEIYIFCRRRYCSKLGNTLGEMEKWSKNKKLTFKISKFGNICIKKIDPICINIVEMWFTLNWQVWLES